MRNWPILLLLCFPAAAAEKAAYDSNGRIIAMLSSAEDVEVTSSIVAVLPGGKRIPLQVRRGGGGANRTGGPLAWSMPLELPDGGRGRIELKSEENAAGVRYTSAITAQTALEVDAIELVIDAPRPEFVGGRATPEGADAIPLAAVRGRPVRCCTGATSPPCTADASGAVALDIGFEKAMPASLVDRWETPAIIPGTRSDREGADDPGANATLTTSLRLANTPRFPHPRAWCWTIRSRATTSTASAATTAGTPARLSPPTRWTT